MHASPYSGCTGKSTLPSSTHKSPLEAYQDAYADAKSKANVTPGTSQRSSFDEIDNKYSQSDCAKDRHSLAEFMAQSPSCTIGQGLLKVTDIDYSEESSSEDLSNEEENLIAESTNAIESLFGGRHLSSKLGLLLQRSISPLEAAEEVEEVEEI